ncbi:amidinotransferase [Flavobacterium sp. L1I52]|uniref:Amidinotransferase n=1 Tax=Flavobacterium pokkalii TaxID=1940408 RepID=A0ABR7URT3_9FLAO|nr:arginine deiminase-related protein [Flavobacterium pokkalii]MBD0725626.1 amidinotransferase [Flavobacterium pokkalii]
MKQLSNSVLMVRPVAFRMNEQTTENNHFQKELKGMLPSAINAKAQQEFDGFVAKLRAVGVQVFVVEDTLDTDTPDSIFPNNWISFHENGDVVLYPMFAENRRNERREDVLDFLEEKGFVIENVVDFSSAEEEGMFLEGTGSLVLDRANSKAYCALSPRADEELFIEFCEDFDCAPVIFEAFHTVNGKKELVYHTNVMMSVGEDFVVICADMIADKKERKMVLDSLRADNKDIILITETQVNNFAGNVLQLLGADKKYIVMSEAARKVLTVKQITQLEQYGEILSSDLDTIEACGGGSARCMLAEIFLPRA